MKDGGEMIFSIYRVVATGGVSFFFLSTLVSFLFCALVSGFCVVM